MAAADDLAMDLHAAIHEYMATTTAWPSDIERLIWTNLDGAVALFLAHLDALNGTPGPSTSFDHEPAGPIQ